MRERGFGRILNVSSSAAREPIPGLMLSSAHRSGMLAAFKHARRASWPADGITLNTILPGRIATDRLAHLYGTLEEAEEVARDEVPAGAPRHASRRSAPPPRSSARCRRAT